MKRTQIEGIDTDKTSHQESVEGDISSVPQQYNAAPRSETTDMRLARLE